MKNCDGRNHSQELAKALDQVQLSLRELDWDDVVIELRIVEREFLALAPPAYQVETKRRVAEALLRGGLFKRRPLASCQSLFEDLRKVDFTDLARAIEYHILYAKLIARNGHIDEGVAVLTQFMTRLQTEPSPVKERALAWVERALAELRPS